MRILTCMRGTRIEGNATACMRASAKAQNQFQLTYTHACHVIDAVKGLDDVTCLCRVCSATASAHVLLYAGLHVH